MQGGDGRRKRTQRTRIGQACLGLAVTAALLQPLSKAEAGLLDRVRDVYRLPEQVQQMEQDYEATKRQLDETIRQSKETEQRLIAQNKQVQEQNEVLQKRLEAMEKGAQDKEARMRKLTNISITAVILAVIYFVSGRLLRVALWRRQRGKNKPQHGNRG